MGDEVKPDEQLEGEVAAKVLRQMEFYFSISNLPRDKFLLGEVEKSAEGLVLLPLICSFARMRELLEIPAVPKGEAIKPVPAEAVAKVAALLREKSTLLNISEDGTMVGRKSPILDFAAAEMETDERTLYVKPFPYDVTVEGLTSFFAEKAGGMVNAVHMRRHQGSKDFKGSIFVEFESKEIANAAKEQALEFAGCELNSEFKLDFIARKSAEHSAKRRGAGGGGEAAAGAAEGEDGGEAEKDESGPAGEEFPLTPGSMLRVQLAEGVDCDKVRFYQFKDPLSEYGRVRHVDYQNGMSSAVVRFAETEGCTAALAGVKEKPLEIGGKEVTVTLLEGEEESTYWAKTVEIMKKAAASGGGRGRGRGRGGGRGGGGRGGFGGRGGGGKRDRDHSDHRGGKRARF